MNDKIQLIIEEYGEEVLDVYYKLFPDKSIEKFDDRFCGFVGSLESWSEECYNSTGMTDHETYDEFMSGMFEQYYYYDYNTETGFVFYNEDR